MDSNTLQAIVAPVEYLEKDEGRHFEYAQERGEDTTRHIHNSIKTVSDWLDTHPGVVRTGDAHVGDFADLWQQQNEYAPKGGAS